MDDAPILVLCTAPDESTAATLARGIVEAKLAACVNIVPGLRSFYRWKGELNDEPEAQLLIKTRRERFADLEAWVKVHHPYDVPELLALEIAAGSREYLAWLEESTR